jgi:hypothetical protein
MDLNVSEDAKKSIGFLQKDVEFLFKLNEFNFENFLRIYRTTDNHYFYNLLSTSLKIDQNLDTQTYYEITIQKSLPWTTISYNEYRTMNLWWLIMTVNNINNPLEYPPPGTKLKILYPQYVKVVVDSVMNQLTRSRL